MLALLAPALALTSPAPTTVLSRDAETRWIAFTLTPYNQIRFGLELNGKVVDAILDTGLSDTIVTSGFAQRNRLEPTRQAQAVAIGGNVPIAWADSPPLRIGGLTRTGGRIGVVRAAEENRFGADMLVGADVLGCCGLDIDFDAKRFRILPSGRLPFTGRTVKLSRARLSGIYSAVLPLSGQTLAPVIVDTGDGASLTLSPAAWSQLRPAGVPVTSALGWGMGGASETQLAVLPALTVAGAAPVEAEVRVEDQRGFLARTGAAGRLGAGLLVRFRVLMDPKAGRMVLRPGAAFAMPVPKSTSGLLVELRGGQLNVVHVMRGSPAATQGWKAGERICAADGVPVSDQIGVAGASDWTAGRPGRTVRLKLCSGPERQLTLAQFY